MVDRTTHPQRRRALKTLAGGSLALIAAPGLAQDDKSAITILVGAASTMDYAARVVADQFHETLNRPAIVLSKLGAGQRVALGELRYSKPDGRTLMHATSGPFVIYPHIYTKLDYDPVKDFTPVCGVGSFDVAIATGPLTGAGTIKELMAWQKKHGDAVFASAPGNGSLSHFVGLATALSAGITMTHVPYKDSGVGIIDLSTGRIPMLVTGLSPLIDFHRNGKIRILAVSGAKRSALVPEVPTLKEAGVDFTATTATALFGPAGMSTDLVNRIHDALNPMFSNPAIRENLAKQAMDIAPSTGPEIAEALVKERQRMEGLVRATGYVAEPG